MDSLKIGEFTFTGEIRATAYYSVWRGFRDSDRSPVVAFIFNPAIVRNEKIGESLLRDTHILAQKQHPGVLTPLAAGRQKSRYFIVYPDKGAPLSTFDTTERVKPREALSIALQILRALLFAADKDVAFHGHVCPDNIVFSLDEGKAMLASFGLMRAVYAHEPEIAKKFKGYLPYNLFAPPKPDGDKADDDSRGADKAESENLEPETAAEGAEPSETGLTQFSSEPGDFDEDEGDPFDDVFGDLHGDGDVNLVFAPGADAGGEGEEPETNAPETGFDPGPQSDMFGLGLVVLELLTGKKYGDLLGPDELETEEKISACLSKLDYIPIPVQEVIIRLISPLRASRYPDFGKAAEDAARLLGEDESSIAFESFIFSTLFGGRFKAGKLISKSACSRIYSGRDIEKQARCVLKVIDLKEYPQLKEPFRNYLKQMQTLDDHTLVKVRDVGVHFELGYIAMDDAGQSLEDLLIRRGMLPLHDAAYIVHQIAGALEFLYFNNVETYGGLKPTNVFLSTNLREVKIGDVFLSRFLLEHGNLAGTSSEYFPFTWCRDGELSRAGDFYSLGLVFYELLVGHPPFSYKVEEEIIRDHIEGDTIRVVQDALISSEAKQIIMRLLERNPGAGYRTADEIRKDIAAMMGWDKKEKLELPHIPFDFADVSVVGKNTKEKVEETICYRLPTKGDKPRGFFALVHGQGEELGDAGTVARLALENLREAVFTPGQDASNPASLLANEPEKYLLNVFDRVNQSVYRHAFRKGRLKRMSVSITCGFIQNNTLYLLQNGENATYYFHKGEYGDFRALKGAVLEEKIGGPQESSLDVEPADALGVAERFRVGCFKKRLKDAEQIVFLSRILREKFSVAEIREFITSQDNPAISIELIEKNARRRRLEGTISAVLVNIGEVTRFVEDSSHKHTGNLARSYMESADQLFHDGKVDEAITVYQKAIEHNSNYTTLHFKLGRAYHSKGLKERALGSFLTAIELDNQHIPAHVEACKIYLELKMNSHAYDLLGRLITRGVEDADVYAYAAAVCNRIRRPKEAADYAAAALELKQGHPVATKELMSAGKMKRLGF